MRFAPFETHRYWDGTCHPSFGFGDVGKWRKCVSRDSKTEPFLPPFPPDRNLEPGQFDIECVA